MQRSEESMIVTRKTLIILTVIACLGLVLTPGSHGGRRNLTFWSWRTEDVDAYNKFIAAFNEKHPDINIGSLLLIGTPNTTPFLRYMALRAAGSGPDHHSSADLRWNGALGSGWTT